MIRSETMVRYDLIAGLGDRSHKLLEHILEQNSETATLSLKRSLDDISLMVRIFCSTRNNLCHRNISMHFTSSITIQYGLIWDNH